MDVALVILVGLMIVYDVSVFVALIMFAYQVTSFWWGLAVAASVLVVVFVSAIIRVSSEKIKLKRRLVAERVRGGDPGTIDDLEWELKNCAVGSYALAMVLAVVIYGPFLTLAIGAMGYDVMKGHFYGALR